MAELSGAAGARFTFLASSEGQPPSWERIDDLLGVKLKNRGVKYLACPSDVAAHYNWATALQDDHPNFIWAWIMASALYSDLEAQPYRLDFAEMPQVNDVPSALDLTDTAACVRFIGREWRPLEAGGRPLAGVASFFLRNRVPGPSRLEIEGSAPHPTRLTVTLIGGRDLCHITLTQPASTRTCAVDTSIGGPILFATISPEGLVEPAALPLIRALRLRPGP
jgi:hypothetical protein